MPVIDVGLVGPNPGKPTYGWREAGDQLAVSAATGSWPWAMNRVKQACLLKFGKGRNHRILARIGSRIEIIETAALRLFGMARLPSSDAGTVSNWRRSALPGATAK